MKPSSCPSVDGWVGWICGSILASSDKQHEMCRNETVRPTLASMADANQRTATRTNKDTSILATSAIATPAPKLSDRVLLSDRRAFFAHLHPRPFLISAVRVGSVTASTIFATYVTDQIEYESSNEKLVTAGQITATECDDRNQQWEEVQWSMRWSDYKMKVAVAFARFQATTLLMRLYERIADRRLKVGDDVLDRLTKDTFASGRRKVERNGTDAAGNALTRSEMVTTCLWANVIPFLADATVQWSVVAYGYYTYWKGRQARRRKDEELAKLEYEIDGAEEDEDGGNIEVTVEGVEVAKTPSTDFGTSDDADAGDAICIPEDGWESEAPTKKESSQDDEVAAVTLLLFMKSSRIALSRGVAWFAASYGGAYGTTLWPGWGTILGTSVGDAVVASVLDG